MLAALMLVAGTGLAGTAGAPLAQAQPARAAGMAGPAASWGTAEEVPGTAALNTAGQAGTEAVSCTSAGTCGAGGYYYSADNPGVSPFTTAAANGTWQTAQAMQGNHLNEAVIDQLSCSSAGNCSAAGQYVPEPVYTELFVATETNGVWGKGQLMPGIEKLNGSGYAKVNGLSCPAAGDCSAVGSAIPSNGPPDGYFISENNGVWGKATDVTGLAHLSPGGPAGVDAVSCPAVGDCSAGGNYEDAAGHQQAFVVDRAGGTWGTAREVPGSAALNQGEYAGINAVSCTSAGNCVAGGYSTGRSHHAQALLVTEKNGVWGTAERVPGFAALNTTGGQINTLSCGAAGNCAAGGYYTDSSGVQQAFVVSATNGVWGTAEEVPGTAALNTSGQATVSSLSCGAAGDCAAGGYYDYDEGAGQAQAFVVSATDGVWGTAEEVPGLASLNTDGEAEVSSVSCGAAGSCAAGGYYTDNSRDEQAFVVVESG